MILRPPPKKHQGPRYRQGYRDGMRGIGPDLQDPEYLLGFQDGRRDRRGGFYGPSAEWAPKALVVVGPTEVTLAPCDACQFEVVPDPTGQCPVCTKSIVHAHTRMVNGKPVQVQEYSDKRQRAWHATTPRRSAAPKTSPGKRVAAGPPRSPRPLRQEPAIRAGATQFGQPLLKDPGGAKKQLGLELGKSYTIDELTEFIGDMVPHMERLQNQLQGIIKQNGVAVTYAQKPREVTAEEQRRGDPEYKTSAFRAKKAKRLAEKFAGKWGHKALNDASDAIGGRIICGDMKQLAAVKKELAKGGSFKFFEPPEDFTELEHKGADGERDGYRGMHYALAIPGGRQMELQLRTERQHWWAEMCHPVMEAMQGRADSEFTPEEVQPVAAYMVELSDYYWYLDNDIQAKEPERSPEVAAIMARMFKTAPQAEAAAKSLGLVRRGGGLHLRRGPGGSSPPPGVRRHG